VQFVVRDKTGGERRIGINYDLFALGGRTLTQAQAQKIYDAFQEAPRMSISETFPEEERLFGDAKKQLLPEGGR
jgi:hypothetical protein